jgi:hypothetical protein
MEILAVGRAQPDRTLVATGVDQLPPLRNPARFHVAQPHGCSAADITAAYLNARLAADTP